MTEQTSSRSLTSPLVVTQARGQRLVYLLLGAAIAISWLAVMLATNSWHLFREFWPVSVTMAMGSFVAGSTPGGGSAFAFPVFTKLLSIPSTEARTFGLMIQAVGMTMAGVLIVTRKIPYLPGVMFSKGTRLIELS